ncbi:hypothetical protein [Vibrio parahaemolyticus]|nr:hypothetical protein [Vibrio parahaemolyticus]
MSINDIYDDDGFSDFLGLLIDMGHLEGAAWESLSKLSTKVKTV